MEIEFNGKSYFIKKMDFEPQYQFERRAWFIAKCHSSPENKDSIEEIIRLSKIFSNIEFKKCSYGTDVINKINFYKTLL